LAPPEPVAQVRVLPGAHSSHSSHPSQPAPGVACRAQLCAQPPWFGQAVDL